MENGKQKERVMESEQTEKEREKIYTNHYDTENYLSLGKRNFQSPQKGLIRVKKQTRRKEKRKV